MLITLEPGLQKPMHLQIRDQIRQRIFTGLLKVGDRLEPTRELAKRLGVHRGTVSNAYAELEAEGLIQGTVGRGTFVSPLSATAQSANKVSRRTSNDFFWDGLLAREPRDDSLGRLMASASQPGVVSFAAAHGSEELSPVDLVRRGVDAVLRREGWKLLQYGSSDGYPPLKTYLQGRLGRDGIAVDLEEILITNGCQQSLDLLSRTLVESGDTVVCENPTYTGLWNLFGSSGAHLVGVPVTAEGMDLDYLSAVLEKSKAKLILSSPNFHNPTGRTMSLASRKRLLELATRFQVPVAEDDIYGALRYAGRALPPLKALDAAGLVIHLNSFSKVGFAGLRVGWIVASRRLIERLRGAKQRADLHTNLLGQAVLAELGQRGWLDQWIRRAAKVCAQKLDVFRRSTERHFPLEAKCLYPEGGMSVWVELPEGLDAGELLVKSQERGVIFAPSSFFYFQNPQRNALRLCFTALPDEQIEKGVALLGELLKAEIARERSGKKGLPAPSSVALV